ncbi:MAG: 50S ribosomal protein L37ae [Thermoplasmata archaeon]|nr:MAG: 50S ribosomal protein L37ae [Thermoplasmata archaeon]
MPRKTKKVGIAGKYGARYGVKVRKQIRTIEAEKVKRHTCPRCQHKSVKRIGTGIWRCRRCNLTFASGAYSPVQSKAQAVEAYKPMEEEANV